MPGIGIVILIVVGLAVLVVVGGWIVPLILSIIGRRRNWPSARGLRIVSLVWGGLALLLAVGIGGLVFMSFMFSRMGSSYDDTGAKLFQAADYKGKTATLRLANAGGVELVLRDQAGKTFRCATTNGNLVVPAGTLTIRECKIISSDSGGKPWTALARFWNETNISVDADTVQDLKFGPPFLVAVNMEWTPVSDKISLDPACADRSGHIYTIKGGQNVIGPSFQVLDANKQVIWSGKFEAG